MGYLDNILRSGHMFSDNENLMKFHFALINSMLLIIITFMFMRYVASITSIVPLDKAHESITLPYILINMSLIFLLRKKREFYVVVANIIMVSMLFIIYVALLSKTTNELRLSWFYTPLFMGFVLMGKRYGVTIVVLILISLFFIDKYIGLGYSNLALTTFYGSVLMFTAFAYVFLYKIEKDAKEFEVLNGRLKEKISEEVRHREEQEKMLLRQCRMANMGEMIDAIAHQWRQPLMNINAILMNIDILSTQERKDGKLIDESVSEIALLTKHMSRTIEDFRTLYQEEKEKSNFLLHTMINDVLLLMKNNLQNTYIDIEERNSISIVSYKSELTQVIVTLISNAIEALNSGNIPKKKISIILSQNDTHTSISIEDNAGGISDENVEKVFDPYFTTKNQTGGTGLGLYIAQIIIEHTMQGKISVSNTLDGAKFMISIPRVKVL